MKKHGLQHRLFHFFTIVFAIMIMVGLGFTSCSSSKHYGQTVHQRSSYKSVKVKQPRWNTTTSTSTTYYIKKQKPRKRYNP